MTNLHTSPGRPKGVTRSTRYRDMCVEEMARVGLSKSEVRDALKLSRADMARSIEHLGFDPFEEGSRD